MNASVFDGEQRGVGVLTRYLDEHEVDYEVVEHAQTFRAVDEARAAHVSADATAKTVLLRDQKGYTIAVIPASARVDLDKLRAVVGREHLRLASEAEMAADFPDFQLGALPPFGALLATPEVIDRRLIKRKTILCSAGDHEHAVLVDPLETLNEGYVRIGDICRA